VVGAFSGKVFQTAGLMGRGTAAEEFQSRQQGPFTKKYGIFV
jgi:hypothetical protein